MRVLIKTTRKSLRVAKKVSFESWLDKGRVAENLQKDSPIVFKDISLNNSERIHVFVIMNYIYTRYVMLLSNWPDVRDALIVK